MRQARLRRKPTPKTPNPNRRAIDETRELHRVGGAWFEVHLLPIPSVPEERAACFDCVCRRAPEIVVAHDSSATEHWKNGRYARSKRQLSKKEVVAHGLRQDSTR